MFRLPSRMVDERAAVEESQLGEQHRVHERHSGQLLQVHLHREFVLLLLHHEGHLTATGAHFTLIPFITRPSTRCRGESRMRERSAPASSETVRAMGKPAIFRHTTRVKQRGLRTAHDHQRGAASPVIIPTGAPRSESSTSFYQNTSPQFPRHYSAATRQFQDSSPFLIPSFLPSSPFRCCLAERRIQFYDLVDLRRRDCTLEAR